MFPETKRLYLGEMDFLCGFEGRVQDTSQIMTDVDREFDTNTILCMTIFHASGDVKSSPLAGNRGRPPDKSKSSACWGWSLDRLLLRRSYVAYV